MASRRQVSHYQSLAIEASVQAGIITDRRSAPRLPTELVPVAGGHAIMSGDRVVDVIRYDDPWGDGR